MSGKNDLIRIAVVGLNGRGRFHVSAFSSIPGVEISHLVDPDRRTFASQMRKIDALGGRAPTVVTDFRRVLDDSSVDAIAVATPNHWHCLMTAWACQAGKDVFVEKMFSHSIGEGRIAVETAKRHGSVVAHGAQRRAMRSFAGVAEFLRSGAAGRIKWAKAICYRERPSIGFQPIAMPPPDIDFNLWAGPAPLVPFHNNLAHYNWHFFWDFGGGEAGAQAIHQIDVARWGLGDPGHPRRVRSVGGRLGTSDQAETPNTLSTLFEYESGPPLLLEIRPHLLWAYDRWELSTHNYGRVMGNIFETELGTVVDDKFYPHGCDEAISIAPAGGGQPDVLTFEMFHNFVDCMRTRRNGLYSDAEQGHLSATLCHLANISYRSGEQAAPADIEAPFDFVGGDQGPGRALWNDLRTYLDEMNIDPREKVLTLGALLDFDPASETFNTPAGNGHLTPSYREPFVLRH